MKYGLLVTGLFLFTGLLFGQNFKQEWTSIEASIQSKKNLQEVHDTVLSLRQQALRANNMAVAGRCFYYLMQIADQRTEDTLYFKNSRFTDSILDAPQSPPLLKAIMHLLQATRLVNYQIRFFHRNNKNGISSYNARYDYSKLSEPELDTLISRHYQSALQLSLQLRNVYVEELLWLSGNPLSFLFKPDFSDIVYAEYIRMLQHKAEKNYASADPDWLSLTQDRFMRLPDTLHVFTKKEQQIFRWYKQWMQHHQPEEPQAYYFIETLARKFFYNNTSPDSAAMKRYEAYLQEITRSSYATVQAHAVLQLCLIWSNEAAAYNPSANEHDFYYKAGFDSTYRLRYRQALDLFSRHEQLLDSFRYVKNILLSMKEKITMLGLTVRTYDTRLPNEVLPGWVQYRNVAQLYTRVVRISTAETLLVDRTRNLTRFLKLPAVEEKVQSLQLPGDYQWHNTVVKLPSLPAGRYILLYSDTIITDQTSRVNYQELSITNIAVLNNDDRLYVLNRKTGFPLQHASVMVKYNRKQTVHGTTNSVWKNVVLKVNGEGYVTVDRKDLHSVKVVYENDSVEADISEPQTDVPEKLFSKEEYDDLMEYYEETIKLQLFTDRAIYRPGQTVYYKGIFTVRHPGTGELLVLNWRNLKFPFYKKLFYKLMIKFSREKIELYVKDPFGREVDTLKVLPGRFGSFSGSFVLPKQAATGEWNIDMDDFEFTNENNGRFTVEEYRRPTFEISLEKPVTELYLGDSFRVKAKIVSFAGAQLSNTKISYSVSRSGELPAAGASGHFRTGAYSTVELTTGQAYTDEKGEWLISIHDSLLKHYLFTEGRKWEMYYNIEAEAVDATGESHEAETRITLSTRPLTINIPITAIVDRSVMVPLPISVRSDFAGQVKRQVEVKIYVLASHETGKQKALWPESDVWLYPVTDLQKTFPDINFDHNDQLPEDKRLIYSTSVLAGEDKLVLPEPLLQSGHYSIEVVCRSNGKITGEADKSFTVFDRQTGTLPSKTFSFHYMPFNLEERGKPVTWITGNTEQDIYSVYHAAYYTKDGKRTAIQYSYENGFEKRGLHEWRYTIPQRAVDKVLLTHLYVLNNELYREEQTVVINGNPTQPEIIVEQYRRQLVPGGKETFVVAVKTKSDHAAAELMTTMYDASLDKLEKHSWHLPRDDSYFRISNSWNYAISTQVNSTLYNQKVFLTGRQIPGVSVWWFDPETELSEKYHHYQGITEFTRLAYGSVLQGRVSGVDISGANFNEVVVVGYGTTSRRNASSAVVTVRGAASLSGYSNMLIVLDGVPYEGDPSKINTGTITEGIVLKGADATSLYGIRAAGGVLILSTKGPVQLLVPGQAPPPVIRKNFEETAFFYPQLHANRRGYYTFSFTLPESVTRWKWKMLAHTRKAGFAYAEKDLYSQLPLMVQPAVPRFLYQGDQIVLKTRITNLDSAAVSGVLACSIEDEATGEDISRQLLVSPRQNFSIRRQATGSEAFTITIPENFLHPIRIKISGAAKNYSDGEEHVIPVLAKKILATSTVPLLLYKDTTVSPPGLPADAEPYGMGLYITPQPQAALVYSLPYLAFYPYGCAEQTLNKLLAHAVAVKLVRTDSVAQRLTHQDRPAQKTVAGKEVPDQEEQTMPWLQLDHLLTVQQQKLARLLDTLESHKQMEKYFKELADMQTKDGGISWFKGGASSMYISAYVLTGLGKLQNDMLYLNKKTTETVLPGLLARLIYHCDTGFIGSPSGIQSTNYLYARVFWLKQYPLSPEARVTFNTALENFWSKPDRYSLGRQAVMITTTLRFTEKSDRLYQAAMHQLESIRQSAIADSPYGVRWKSIADEEDLTTQTEEWLVKIAEAFETGGQSKQTVAGIITWLLRTKQAHGWSTTKSTAEAVSLLARQQSNILGNTVQLEVMIDGQTARVTNDLFSGSLYTFIKRPDKPFPVAGIRQRSPVSPASGELTYYYFTSKPPVDQNSRQISISKALYRYNKTTKQWDTLKENSLLHITDRVKTILTIATPRQLQYVFIEDKRAASLEPADASSGYRYEDGVNFYRSVKDASMLFFADKIASGIHTISYEALVAQEGTFTNGPALLQCMYQPGVKAYSIGRKVEIK